MSHEWEPNKAAVNVQKHGVQFTEAVGVFGDEYAITIKEGVGGLGMQENSARTAEREQYEAER